MVFLSSRISPFTSTVIFFERSPLATAVVTSALFLTWPVSFASIELTTSLNACAISPSMPVRLSGMRIEKSPRLNWRSAFKSSPRSSIICRPAWIDSMGLPCGCSGVLTLGCYGASTTAGIGERHRRPVAICTTSWLIYDVGRDRVMHQLRVRLHVHLAEDASAVRADGVGAEEELVGDLAHGLARGDHPHHLVLAIGQRLVQRLAAIVLELERELLPERGRDIAPAARDFPDRPDELLGRP